MAQAVAEAGVERETLKVYTLDKESETALSPVLALLSARRNQPKVVLGTI